MADTHDVPPLSIRLVRDDYEWLAKIAKNEDVSVHALVDYAVWHFRNWQEKGKEAVEEVLEGIDDMCREHEKKLRQQGQMRLEYKRQLRRQHDARREYQKQAWRERKLRRDYEKQLRRERTMRREYEKQLQRQQDSDEGQAGTGTGVHRNALYGPKVARLLALAICSDSDGEARMAFAKARALHRPRE